MQAGYHRLCDARELLPCQLLVRENIDYALNQQVQYIKTITTAATWAASAHGQQRYLQDIRTGYAHPPTKMPYLHNNARCSWPGVANDGEVAAQARRVDYELIPSLWHRHARGMRVLTGKNNIKRF